MVKKIFLLIAILLSMLACTSLSQPEWDWVKATETSLPSPTSLPSVSWEWVDDDSGIDWEKVSEERELEFEWGRMSINQTIDEENPHLTIFVIDKDDKNPRLYRVFWEIRSQKMEFLATWYGTDEYKGGSSDPGKILKITDKDFIIFIKYLPPTVNRPRQFQYAVAVP